MLTSGRAYIGGALTTLLNVGLLTEADFDEWFDRLMDELPPAQWVGG